MALRGLSWLRPASCLSDKWCVKLTPGNGSLPTKNFSKRLGSCPGSVDRQLIWKDRVELLDALCFKGKTMAGSLKLEITGCQGFMDCTWQLHWTCWRYKKKKIMWQHLTFLITNTCSKYCSCQHHPHTCFSHWQNVQLGFGSGYFLTLCRQ